MSVNKNVLDVAKAHYQDKIKEMKNFYVEAWDTTIYYRTVTSLAQESEVIELARKNKSVEAMVTTIINKARHEDGTKMFNKLDKNVLMNEVDPGVILKIAEGINGGKLPSAEDIEKN